MKFVVSFYAVKFLKFSAVNFVEESSKMFPLVEF